MPHTIVLLTSSCDGSLSYWAVLLPNMLLVCFIFRQVGLRCFASHKLGLYKCVASHKCIAFHKCIASHKCVASHKLLLLTSCCFSPAYSPKLVNSHKLVTSHTCSFPQSYSFSQAEVPSYRCYSHGFVFN